MNDFTVSAVIPAYNAEQYIRRSIDSVLAQTRPADEIIVVDDGSTDNTAEIVRSYGEKVRLVQKENGGEASARNAGIQSAKCSWISFLDADDFWLPNKLEALVTVLQNNTQLRWAFGNCYIYYQAEDRKSLKIFKKNYAPRVDSKGLISDAMAAYFHNVDIHSNTGIFHREVFENVGLFKDYRRGTDLDMWLRIMFAYEQVGFSSEPIAEYQIDVAGNATSSWPQEGSYVKWLSSLIEDADKANAMEKFKQYLPDMLFKRVRGMLFHSVRANEAKEIINTFGSYLPAGKTLLFRFALICPPLTQLILRAISTCVRTLKLRKKVIKKNY